MHAAAEASAQRAADDWELARAADDVDAGDVFALRFRLALRGLEPSSFVITGSIASIDASTRGAHAS